MKKSFNYISYCIYSFMPLYFVLLIYTFVKQDLDALLLTTILTIISIFSGCIIYSLIKSKQEKYFNIS